MISQFALRLICGMSLMWALMPRREVTSGFFRIQNLVVMGLGVLAALGIDSVTAASPRSVGRLDDSWNLSLALLLSVFAFFSSVLWTLERRTFGTAINFGILALSTVLLILTNLPVGQLTDWFDLVHPISQLIGAVVMGSAVVGMLLGHWYLTSPTMSIAPLFHLNRSLGLAAIARFVLSAIPLTSPILRLHVQESPVVLIWISLRWLAGILGPIVVSVMVWRILKYRNTQAATGVLFVGVILAFIGDMMAALLLKETGLPL